MSNHMAQQQLIRIFYGRLIFPLVTNSTFSYTRYCSPKGLDAAHLPKGPRPKLNMYPRNILENLISMSFEKVENYVSYKVLKNEIGILGRMHSI